MNIYRYVGIPFQRKELEAKGGSFVLDKGPVWITDNIVASGEIPMTTEFERVAPELFVKEGEGFVPDSLLDDRALTIKADQGLIVIAGCAHRGIINTLLYARELTGEDRIHSVIGGFHLHRASEEQRELTIAALKDMDIQRLSGCHCTGLPTAARMAQEFGDSYFFNGVGVAVDLS
jgi:7,8-dihydropterin-6-yl-methyl-4-(beta-D-ribofuranosyl)aminobenzene 5'-phosphate synthase